MSYADDLAVTQLLGMCAVHYAVQILKPGHLSTVSESEARVALYRAQQPSTGTVDENVIGALRDLQMAAVMFAVQLVDSEGKGDAAVVQQLEDKAIAWLECQSVPWRFHVHDDLVAAQHLGRCALAYAQQIVIAEDSGAPLGSAAVVSALRDLHMAAVGVAMQGAVSGGHPQPKALRRIEARIMALLKQRVP